MQVGFFSTRLLVECALVAAIVVEVLDLLQFLVIEAFAERGSRCFIHISDALLRTNVALSHLSVASNNANQRHEHNRS